MQALTRVARESAGRLAALTATTGATIATQRPAHAHAPRVQRPEAVRPLGADKDEWLVTHVDASQQVIFSHEDIDSVANEVLQLVPRLRSGQNSDGTVSEGQAATDVIEDSELFRASGSAPIAAPQSFEVLLRVATELMKKPAVQQEVVGVILKDPDLLTILAEKSNLDMYLTQWGISSAGLLPPATVIEEAESTADAEEQAATPGDHPLELLFAALKGMGGAMHQVVGWLQRTLLGWQHHGTKPGAPANPASGGTPGGKAGGPAGPGGIFQGLANNPVVLTAVGLGVALVCVLLLRQPQMLAALARQRALAAAAATTAAAAGTAAAVAAVAKK